MNETTQISKKPQASGKVIGLWIFRLIIAGAFLAAAIMKLSGQPMMVAEFATVGLGQWFRYFTGLLELSGAMLVLWPRTTGLGALVLLMVDIGAFFAQISVLHIDWTHTIVLGGLLLLLAYLNRSSIWIVSR